MHSPVFRFFLELQNTTGTEFLQILANLEIRLRLTLKIVSGFFALVGVFHQQVNEDLYFAGEKHHRPRNAVGAENFQPLRFSVGQIFC